MLVQLMQGVLALASTLVPCAPAHDDHRFIPPQIGADQVGIRSLAVEGRVLHPGGAPADGAVVMSGAEGRAVTDRRGLFTLTVQLDLDAVELEVTAVHTGPGGTSVASSRALAPGSANMLRLDDLHLVAGSGCQPAWVPTFGEYPGIIGTVHALAVFDDGAGAGPALYAAGSISQAGGILVSNIARWDGNAWSSVGVGLPATVRALTVFDDGGGAALYAGGDFTGGRVARWDGTSWTSLGSGVSGGDVYALAVHDDGGGAALFVGGSFTTAGGATANRIARWNGTTWSALGSGLGNTVRALVEHDDGSATGLALYAGGSFTTAGGAGANRIARWDGAAWSLDGGGCSGVVNALAVTDDGPPGTEA